MKKNFIRSAVSTAMLSTLLVCSAANAEDVNQTITSNDVPIASTCAAAGTVSLEFIGTTTAANLVEGDKIEIDLPFLSATEKVTLCKSIDLLVAPTALNGNAIDTAYDQGYVGPAVAVAAGSAVSYTGVAAEFTAATGGLNFHITGNAGGNRITVELVGITAGLTDDLVILDDGADEVPSITVKMFDSNIVEIWKDVVNEAGTDVYDSAIVADDNTLCINVSQWLNSNVVNASLNSVGSDGINGKYTFDATASSELAHTQPQISIGLDQCKPNPGTQLIGYTAVQADGGCYDIDNEATLLNDSPLCAIGDARQDNRIFIVSDTVFENSDYNVKLEILVNGETGNNGAYFKEQAIAFRGDVSLSDNCANTDSGVAAATDFYRANGTTAANFNGETDNDCLVSTSARAVIAEARATDMDADGINDDSVWVDIPTIQSEGLVDGDVVSVRVTLTKGACDNLFEDEFEVVTMLATCPSAASGSLSFPYFTAGNADADAFWDGIAVTNMSSAAGTVVLTMTEADGDIFVTEPMAITAGGMIVKTLSALITEGAFTLSNADTPGSGVAGDARSHIIATSTDVNIDGFGMISDPATGQSMGYLPRMN